MKKFQKYLSGKIYLELDITKVKFYQELDISNVKFQNSRILLHNLRRGLFN